MVPFYLCYMAGLSMAELRGGDQIAPGVQRRLVASSVFFALGVSTIFVLLGLGATALGQAYNLLIAWAARKDETTSLLRGGKEANRWSIATTARSDST